jgi:hypothetical protein
MRVRVSLAVALLVGFGSAAQAGPIAIESSYLTNSSSPIGIQHVVQLNAVPDAGATLLPFGMGVAGLTAYRRWRG